MSGATGFSYSNFYKCGKHKDAKRTALEFKQQWQYRGGIEAAFSQERALLTALARNTMTRRYLQDMMHPSTTRPGTDHICLKPRGHKKSHFTKLMYMSFLYLA